MIRGSCSFEFLLAFPVTAIGFKHSLVHALKLHGFTISQDVILKATQQPLVELQAECIVIPLGHTCYFLELVYVAEDAMMVVHFEHVLLSHDFIGVSEVHVELFFEEGPAGKHQWFLRFHDETLEPLSCRICQIQPSPYDVCAFKCES
jgi:hypothetical protein